MIMNKKLIFAIGLVAIIVMGLGIYGNLKNTNPINDETAMKKEMTTEVMSDEMSEEIEDESMAAGESTSKEAMKESTDNMKNEGKAAPAFDLMDVSGNSVSLESLKGERVYIKFWASWCSICLAGMEELDELSANMEGIKVITIVSPDFNGEQSSDDFIKWYSGLDYENIIVLLDPKGEIAKEYGVRAYPTSAYIGSDGILVKQLPGHVSNEKVVENFKSIY